MRSSASIILGTAQFGMAYGVANRTGQLDADAAAETIRIARGNGIRLLDTAVAYGQSESQLGSIGLGGMEILTKLPDLPVDCADIRRWVRGQVETSLERLRVPVLRGLTFHRPEQLLEKHGKPLYDEVRLLQAEGVVEQIGISIYHPQQLDRLMEVLVFDMVQAPFNVFDRRIVDSGWAARLGRMGCEVHARSVFLQGLLLLSETERPAQFRRWSSLFAAWEGWLASVDLTPLQACVRFAFNAPEMTKVIIGVDGPRQLEEILSQAGGVLPAPPIALSCVDPDLLDPSRWGRA